MPADPNTFLKLSPEFGGTKFGPFTGLEVRLGSDPNRNDIVLPAALGVASEHVKLIRQGEGSYVVAPTERTAAVYIWKMDGRPPKQTITPCAIQPGDGFSLVTPEGPRFYLIEEMPAYAGGTSDGFGNMSKEKSRLAGIAKRRLTPGAIWHEIKRQGWMYALTNPAARAVQRLYVYTISGAIFMPRNIIMFMMVGSGFGLSGFTACKLRKASASVAQAQTNLAECEGDKAIVQGLGRGGENATSLPKLTAKLLGDSVNSEWEQTLVNDEALASAYVRNLKKVRQSRSRYEWVYTNSSSGFTSFQTALGGAGMDPQIARVLAYAAALPGQASANRNWFSVPSPEGDTCGHGPLALTYRQGRNMGLEVQLDAYAPKALAQGQKEEQRAAIVQTARLAGVPAEFNNDQIKWDGTGLQGGYACLYIDGPDQRANQLSTMASALNSYVGASAQNVPAVDTDAWVAARIARLYTANLPGLLPQQVVYQGSVSRSLNSSVDSQDQISYVIDQTAFTMARAILIPCMARLDKAVEDDDVQHLQPLPGFIDCALVEALLEYEL